MDLFDKTVLAIEDVALRRLGRPPFTSVGDLAASVPVIVIELALDLDELGILRLRLIISR